MDGACRVLRTAWIPTAEVEKTETVRHRGRRAFDGGARRARRRCGGRGGAAPARRARTVSWIDERRSGLASLAGRRQADGRGAAALRPGSLRTGSSVASPCWPRTRTRSMPSASRTAPWRARCGDGSGSRRRAGAPFQLAFVLLNLPGLADPRDPHRETVDLLFFPTGGGKTEAYLGLAAFAMVLRRLRHPGESGLAGAGVSVIMRYTLRLLTLDQLARAAGLVCALELERERGPSALRRVAVRDRPLGRQGRDAQHPRAQGRRALGLGAHQGATVQGRPAGQALADSARELPVVRHALRSQTPSRCCPTTTTRASCASSARTSSATSRATARFPSWPWTSRSTGGCRPS